MLKFAGAKKFTAKDGTDFIAIPVDANNIYQGEKGSYLTLTLMDNRDGVDQYGNEGFVTIDIGKERRLAGDKGPILGNWKTIGQRPTTQNGAKPPIAALDDSLDDDSDIPF
jgi:hypothetical protein